MYSLTTPVQAPSSGAVPTGYPRRLLRRAQSRPPACPKYTA